MTDLLKKIGNMEKTITIFDTTIMRGRVGVVKNVEMPSLEGNSPVRFNFPSLYWMEKVLMCSGDFVAICFESPCDSYLHHRNFLSLCSHAASYRASYE